MPQPGSTNAGKITISSAEGHPSQRHRVALEPPSPAPLFSRNICPKPETTYAIRLGCSSSGASRMRSARLSTIIDATSAAAPISLLHGLSPSIASA